MAPSAPARFDFPLPFPLARWEFALGLAVLAGFIVFSIAARFTVPYRDDWDWLNAMLTTPMSLRSLFMPHNEHVIPLARIIHSWQYRLEGGEGWTMFVIAVLHNSALAPSTPGAAHHDTEPARAGGGCGSGQLD
jgi:hypothetical protein